MTDVLSVQHDALDDLTSDAETPPQAAPSTPESVTCRYCPSTFEGPARFIRRGRHESKDHPDEYLKAKATGRKPKARKTSKAAKKPAATKSVTPGKKRIAAGDSIGTVLGMVAQVVVRVDAPTGRALALSSTATGEAVDQLVAGTIVDRLVIQKFAGAADKWEKVGGVIAFPVLVAVVSRNPALFDPLEGQLRSAALDVITASVPSLEKQKKREKMAVDALRRLGQVDERYAQTDDPIGLILRDIFGVPEAGGDAPE